ncbi:MAG: sulfatase-like hydrolase/transferase [Proteobacteria bacterium]|nr:sulfatase-like hydrolase/transferase [Pseudomonadota bacterium]
MASRDPARPNILFILSDDQGAWSLGCAGNDEIRTPHLDALAATGIRFTDFFCTSPVCSPARASLMTGCIPSQHGVHDWIRDGNVGATRIDYLAGQSLLTDHFAAAGWRCALIGKWHLGASDAPRPGYVRWFAHQSGMSRYYDAPMCDETRLVDAPGYLTEVLTHSALGFLDAEAARDEPFWLSLNYTAPHYPWIDSHPREYTDLYRDCPFHSCPDEPPHPNSASGNPATDAGHAQRRANLIGYYAAMTAMDAGIGQVLAALAAHDLARSTLVIFMSDNGMNCGHHGIWGKGNGTRPQNMYDTSVKVPCIFAQPGRVAPAVSDAMLSGYDVYPTLLDYAGLPPHRTPRMPGRSFAGLLRSGRARADAAVVVYDEYGPTRMLRTRDWKYVHRYPDGPHELYDLAGDPGERRNRVDDPACGATLASLRAQLDAWFADHVDPLQDGARKPVIGTGQLALSNHGAHDAAAFALQPIVALTIPTRSPQA